MRLEPEIARSRPKPEALIIVGIRDYIIGAKSKISQSRLEPGTVQSTLEPESALSWLKHGRVQTRPGNQENPYVAETTNCLNKAKIQNYMVGT